MSSLYKQYNAALYAGTEFIQGCIEGGYMQVYAAYQPPAFISLYSYQLSKC